MALDAVKNFAKVTVSTGYDASATSIVLTTGHGAKLPAASFNATWWNATDYGDPSDDPNVEIVRVTNISTDTLTITRAQESTSASTKNTGGKTYKMIAGLTAKVISTDIFASPTIVTPTIASFANAGHSHLNAAGGGTITAGAISDLATAAVAFTNKTGAISQWTNDSSFTTLGAVAGVGYLTAVTAHNLLSATHGDTLTDTVVRGDILYGTSTPKWARLAKPSVLSGLSHDGTDVSWVTATGTGAPVRAASPTFITSVLLPNGLVGTPSVGFGSESGLGFYRSAGSTITFTASGSALFTISSSGLYVPDAAQIGWSNGLFFQRDAYGVLALRNGSAPQKTRFYNTFTTVDTAGEWFEVDWQTTANLCILSTRKGSSTGTLRGMQIGASSLVPIGFYGATPITRAVLATGASHTVDDVITALQNIGLVSQT